MSDVLIFNPKHKLDFSKNFNDFIAFVKNELTWFLDQEHDGKKGWECDRWTIESNTGRKLSFVFGVFIGGGKHTPFSPQFADFAKAYVCYQQSINPKNSVGFYKGFTWLYQALTENAEQNNHPTIDIMDINNTVINRAEELIAKNYRSGSGRYACADSMERVLEFIKEKRFKLDLQSWKNPFSVTNRYNKLDEESRNLQMEKCPSDYQMMQVAEAFRCATTPRQKFYSSIMVMLMCQPSRGCELSGLTVNSLQKSDKERWYLMWHPAKGGHPVRKWIPKQLENAVQRAFKRLIKISAPARAAAKFAHENPGVYMPHERCITPENFSQDKPLTYDQFAKAVGLATGTDPKGNPINWVHISSKLWNKLISNLNNVSDWRKELLKGGTLSSDNEVVNRFTHKGTGVYIKMPCLHDLRVVVDKRYRNTTFPNVCGDIKVWDSLTFIRENEFHKDYNTRLFSWVRATHGSFSNAFGTKSEGMDTIFEELGITDEDGSPLVLTTHQFRHWLNTKLMLAGEEDWLIAKWSGRADVKQNKAYDGRTQKQKSRLTKRIGHVSMSEGVMTVAQANQLLAPHTAENPPTPIVLHDLGLPISLKSLGVKREGVAQFTGLGFCVHNYAESPCVKNGDCAVCSDHVCLKGLPNSLEELKTLEKLYEEQLKDAIAKVGDDVFGADRWVTSTGFKLTKVKTIITMLEDPNRLDGTPVRIPDKLDPSPVKRSLHTDEHSVITTFDLTSLALSDMRE